MKTFFNNIKKIALNEKSKAEIRGKLVIFMKENPISERQTMWQVPFSFLQHKYRSMVFFSLVIIFMAFATVAIEADQSLPGEMLYPVKTEANEHIQEALTFSDKKKDELHIKCVENRLREAEILFFRGDISEKAEKQLREAFKKHSEEAIERLNAIKNADEKKKIFAEFETMLEAHKKILVSSPLPSQKSKPLIDVIYDIQKSVSLICLELDENK